MSEEHLCIPKQNQDGTFDARLAGDRPIDCVTCGRSMTFKEALDNLETADNE